MMLTITLLIIIGILLYRNRLMHRELLRVLRDRRITKSKYDK
jgi:hypothetical protein